MKQSRLSLTGHICDKGFDGSSDQTQDQLVDPGEKLDLFAPSEKSWSQDSPFLTQHQLKHLSRKPAPD